MVYRKKYRSHRKRKVFTEREKDAIIRISQAPVETKAFTLSATLQAYLIDTNYTSGTGSHAWASNVYSVIPANNSTSTTPHDSSFLGNEFQSRGLRWEGTFWSGDGNATPGANYDTWFRFTVYEIPDYVSGNRRLVNGTANEWDKDVPGEPTLARWNMDLVKIRFQKRFKLDNNGSLNAITHRKFWVPIQRKIEKAEELSDTNTTMGLIKGLQVYWALEMFSPGNTGSLALNMQGRISTVLYFKDA